MPPDEPTHHGTSHTSSETPFPPVDKSFTPNKTPFSSGAKSFTPSESLSSEGSSSSSDTVEPSGDTTDNDSGKPGAANNQDRTRAASLSNEWDKEPPPLIAEGQVLFGKYRLDEQIGEGGMGSVWKVWHVDMESERALKLIKPEIAQNDKGWNRFRREAQLMDKIKHPGAVRVYDYKRAHGLGYIEMEFVRGQSLEQVLKSHGGKPMPLDWTAQVVEQLCAVLQEAHGHVDEKTGAPKPIIHRDLKPSNLMLIETKNKDQAIQLKVLDFGIAKMIEDDGGAEQTVTVQGDVLGTPAYMSPEQIKYGFEKDAGQQAIDGRSDLYATGVVLYQLLTGVRPFRGNSMSMIGAHLNFAPPPMREANPEAKVPPEVERVVLQCLEKDPAKRPQSARELADKFLQAVGRAPKPPSNIVAAALAAAAAVVLMVCSVGLWFWPKTSTLQKRIVVTQNDPKEIESPPQTPVKAWLPPGYDPDGDEMASDSPGEFERLRRKDDGVVFVHSKPGVYIPEGYTAEFDAARPDVASRLRRRADGAQFDRSPDGVYLPIGYKATGDDMTGPPWPTTIVRSKDKVKFIRIVGGTYQRGDPNIVDPALDSEGYPCTPHFVSVTGFYIQEMEVTNGEIDAYIQENQDRAKELIFWKALY